MYMPTWTAQPFGRHAACEALRLPRAARSPSPTPARALPGDTQAPGLRWDREREREHGSALNTHSSAAFFFISYQFCA